jgi:hypothetical protein
MQRPRPGEIWRFTKHTKISKQIVIPGTLLFILESDELNEQHPTVFRLKAVINSSIFDFYTPASYMELV